VEFVLPRVAGPTAPEPAPLPTAIRTVAAPATILLVEDDRANCDLLREVLEMDGHRVLAGQSAAAALEAAAAERVDLLLTDVVLPGMTGFELAARLHTSGQPVRVIYMSGYTEQTVADRGAHLGPDDAFLHKPFGLDELMAKVGEALASRPGS
jgi:CheY-like chemotaxis protein